MTYLGIRTSSGSPSRISLLAELPKVVIEMAPLERLPLFGRQRSEEGMRQLGQTAWPGSAEALDQGAQLGFLRLEIPRIGHAELGRCGQPGLPWFWRQKFLLGDPSK